MPTRKTSDISHEQLTDHDIEARPRTWGQRCRYAHADCVRTWMRRSPCCIPQRSWCRWATGPRVRGSGDWRMRSIVGARWMRSAATRAESLLAPGSVRWDTADAVVYANLGYAAATCRAMLAEARDAVSCSRSKGDPANEMTAATQPGRILDARHGQDPVDAKSAIEAGGAWPPTRARRHGVDSNAGAAGVQDGESQGERARGGSRTGGAALLIPDNPQAHRLLDEDDVPRGKGAMRTAQ